MNVRRGLPESMRPAAAALYWQAFGPKLGRVLGPTRLALRFLERVIRADHCYIALDEGGALVGIAGFKTMQGSFAGGTSADLREVYGFFGSTWRGMLLWSLNRELDNDRFLLDGICVAAGMRSRGVGSALIAHICIEAQARGYPSVRLDVVDSNVRARALYERLGFSALRTVPIGPLQIGRAHV